MVTITGATDERGVLVSRLAAARAESDRLFALLRPEALYERPIPERHRIIFYRGHLEAFDWNLLQPCLPGVKALDPSLDQLFAAGIDPVEGGLPVDTPADWPAEETVARYGQKIREKLDTALGGNCSGWSSEHRPAMLLNAAIEHRLMHAETLAYMWHQLPHSKKLPEPQAAVPERRPVEPEQMPIPAGAIGLGLARGDDGVFGWDNEYETYRISLGPFAIDRYKVTHSQFLRFLNDGGYETESVWTPQGWEWIQRQGIRHPVFWRPDKENWRYRTMFSDIALPPDWPVYVSHAEATAYAKWAGMRLPSEAEWQFAAYGTEERRSRRYPWGDAAPDGTRGYFHFSRWDPSPVNAFPDSRSAFGVEGLMANGWEWTNSPLAPFPGFEPFSFYPGYSADFFDGRHLVMKGGSMRTDQSMLRPSFRNWFQPHYQYAYAGFRCVRC